jgi:hypothetical protein
MLTCAPRRPTISGAAVKTDAGAKSAGIACNVRLAAEGVNVAKAKRENRQAKNQTPEKPKFA